MIAPPPAPMGWLDTIVNVQWGGPFAALTFQSRWVSDSRNPPTIDVSIPALSPPFNMFGNNGDTPLFQPTPPYHNQTSVTLLPYTTVTTTYDFQVSTPFSNGNGVITVFAGSDGSSGWSSDGGPSGVGGIDAAQAYYLANGWSTFASEETGQTSHTDPGPKVYTELDNAVWLFNIRAIKEKLGPSVASIPISFDTGNGPLPITHHAGLPAYVWTATFYTFKVGSFGTFKVDATNLPTGWPHPVTTSVVTSPAYPTPSQHVAFTIPL